ncbi:hypothetical protein [Kitasatospora sp. MBT63]|nr:hypothetical protein [Kitasatospora sp. MBT63]
MHLGSLLILVAGQAERHLTVNYAPGGTPVFDLSELVAVMWRAA